MSLASRALLQSPAPSGAPAGVFTAFEHPHSPLRRTLRGTGYPAWRHCRSAKPGAVFGPIAQLRCSMLHSRFA